MQRREFLRKGLALGSATLIPGVGLMASELFGKPLPFLESAITRKTDAEIAELFCEAIEKEQLDAIKSIIRSGVDVNIIMNDDDWNDDDWTPLHYAAYYNSKIEVWKYLVFQGADVNAKSGCGLTPLLVAADYHNNIEVEVVRFLVHQGADVNVKDSNGAVLLHRAARKSSVEVLEFLLSLGADVNAKVHRDNLVCPYDFYMGCTPLLFACNNSKKVLEYLISQGADLNVKDDKYGRTPAHWAVYGGATSKTKEVLEYLVSLGINLNVKDTEGNTPLIYALGGIETKEVLKYLISHGLDVNTRNNTGQTILHGAIPCLRIFTDEVEHIVSLGVDVNARDNKGKTPLHLAAMYSYSPDSLQDIPCLIAHGANPLAKDNQGKTPLDMARRKETRQALLEWM